MHSWFHDFQQQSELESELHTDFIGMRAPPTDESNTHTDTNPMRETCMPRLAIRTNATHASPRRYVGTLP